MPAHGGYSITDYNGEKSPFGFGVGPITPATLPAVLSGFGNLRGAIENIIIGVVNKEWLYAFDTPLTNVWPGDVNAQRERKWLIIYEDSTQFLDLANAIPNPGYLKKFTGEIPTADFSGGRLLPGKDEGDLSETTMAAFVNQFQLLAKSPYGGTPRVLSMTGVGRNL